MRGGQAVSEYDARDEAALDALSVLDGDVAPLDEGLLLGVALDVCSRAAAEERYECLVGLAWADRAV